MRDLRQLARDIQALKEMYPDRPNDRAKRVFFAGNGEVVCVNGVDIGMDGFEMGRGNAAREINIMLKIPDNYPIAIPGESHNPEFGIPATLGLRGGDLSGAHVHALGGWADANWRWVCLLFDPPPTNRNLVASVNLLMGALRRFAREGR
jgi:hypothetical protein